MWLREYTSLSPLSTNHRLCQVCRLEPHFMRYPLRITFVASIVPGCRDGDAASPVAATVVEPDGCAFPFVVYACGFDGELSSESEDVKW